jgi:CDP-6-deoxy-D-xylo-4-hexulose-3-dehydrase
MFEGMTEAQAREKLLAMVAEYHDAYHVRPPFKPGQKIPYAARMYDGEEMVGLVDSALDFWLTSGRFTAEFERRLAACLGVGRCAFVNSGSSANLLAFMTLTSPMLKERRILPGDEVITVAAGFPTTVSPMVQYGAVPVFIDITIPQYNLDTAALEAALSDKTKAVMAAHTLGNPFDLAAVREFCQKNSLWLIEDNCDALGSLYLYEGKERPTGTIGDIGTSSFYPAHHITTGEGGAVYTNDNLLSKIIFSMRDWGRDCQCAPGQDNLCGNRFSRQFGGLPGGYDHKYVYSHLGYNLKATDMQAAIGVKQLDKLPGFVEKRRRNFDLLRSGLESKAAGSFILPEPCPNSKPSWFGFVLTCQNGLERGMVVRRLEEKGVQTRMLFSGNLVKQPCFSGFGETGWKYRTVGDLPNTNRTLNDTFWLGVYPGLTDEQINYMLESILDAI